ncbi:MAG: aspartate aminotransferase [Cyanobacteria bacterium CRU_2_1]|nr:aspartate aminotransferase [Cyanobacteria bacterium RU_5_0]NJR62529.1 aspartate aminotransferase [Cyanobacteria bacterium CRU_2_1]
MIFQLIEQTKRLIDQVQPEDAENLSQEEGQQELKLELVSRMLDRGLSIEEVAELLGLTVEQVSQSQQRSQND